MKYIDIGSWNRKTLFKLFASYLDPTLRIDVRLNVTKLIELKNQKKVDGFFIPFTYLLMKTMNEFEELRLRIDDNGVAVYDKIDPSFTVALEDGNFSFLTVPYIDTYKNFEKICRENINKVVEDGKKGKVYQTNQKNVLGVAYLSALPWIDVVSFSNPLPLGNNSLCSIPRINWSKYVEENGQKVMTLSNTFSHALVDGYAVSKFILRLKEALSDPEKYLF